MMAMISALTMIDDELDGHDDYNGNVGDDDNNYEYDDFKHDD